MIIPTAIFGFYFLVAIFEFRIENVLWNALFKYVSHTSLLWKIDALNRIKTKSLKNALIKMEIKSSDTVLALNLYLEYFIIIVWLQVVEQKRIIDFKLSYVLKP